VAPYAVISPISIIYWVGACVPESLDLQLLYKESMIVTKAELKKARTPAGGFTGKQQRMGREWAGSHKWSRKLIGVEVPDNEWLMFVRIGVNFTKGKNKSKPEIINKFSTGSDWSWKPETSDIPEIKLKSKNGKNQGKKKKRRRKVSRQDNSGFYSSREWLELRVRVLESYECKCMMCGRSPKDHGIVIHVDHIKPRSKRPELSLNFSNLQLLCAACNRGKSNKYQTDWRPNELQICSDLDEQHLTSIQHLI